MTSFALNIKENSIDSLNEALDKFQQGQAGNVRAFKFAILCTAQFIELLLKQYLISVNPLLVYTKCFGAVQSRAKADKVSLKTAYERLITEGFDFDALMAPIANPHTVKVDEALAFARLEMCSKTGVEFVDKEFEDDIKWLKQLRNDIEHFQFALTAKEVRLCIGRIVRSAIEFCDIFSLMDLSKEIGMERFHVFEMLADEYTQFLVEAREEIRLGRIAAFKGHRPKEYQFVEWNVYRCDECGENTMIPDPDSSTGYKCKMPHCGNEESGEIEVACDVCGVLCQNEDMEYWDEELSNVCADCANHPD